MKRFSNYMDDWLYGKNGYYSTLKSIGKKGDFYTAVSTSRFFGATISSYMISLIKSGKLSDNLNLIEIGAHQGYLLADMIEWIAQEEPMLLDTMKFGIVERFDCIKETQQSYFKSRFDDAIKLDHYSDLSEINAKEAFIVANEIFDSFACDLIYKQKIALVDERTHTICFDGEDEEVFKIADRYGQTKGEVARGYESFASSLHKVAKKIVFVTFDYGEKESRVDFSIRIYKEHDVYPLFEERLDLKSLFSKSDITYDVNFSHLIDAFKKSGFFVFAYKTQLRALIEYGLLNLLEQLAKLGNQTLYLRELNKVKTLIDPTMMGERFKLVEFHKNIDL